MHGHRPGRPGLVIAREEDGSNAEEIANSWIYMGIWESNFKALVDGLDKT